MKNLSRVCIPVPGLTSTKRLAKGLKGKVVDMATRTPQERIAHFTAKAIKVTADSDATAVIVDQRSNTVSSYSKGAFLATLPSNGNVTVDSLAPGDVFVTIDPEGSVTYTTVAAPEPVEEPEVVVPVEVIAPTSGRKGHHSQTA